MVAIISIGHLEEANCRIEKSSKKIEFTLLNNMFFIAQTYNT